MRTHRLTATIASLFLLGTPAVAMAMPADDTGPRAVAPTISLAGDTKSDLAVGAIPAPATSLAGDTKSDLAVAAIAAPTAGDTKSDAPGASRAPEYDPPATIQVLRPERTIVRDVNEELPVILGGVALLIALAVAGLALLRTRRIVVGR